MSSNARIGKLRVGGQPAKAQVWSRKMRTLVVQTMAKPEPLVQAPTTTVQLIWSSTTANADYQDTNTCRIAEVSNHRSILIRFVVSL